jgi:hypothetical protein
MTYDTRENVTPELHVAIFTMAPSGNGWDLLTAFVNHPPEHNVTLSYEIWAERFYATCPAGDERDEQAFLKLLNGLSQNDIIARAAPVECIGADSEKARALRRFQSLSPTPEYDGLTPITPAPEAPVNPIFTSEPPRSSVQPTIKLLHIPRAGLSEMSADTIRQLLGLDSSAWTDAAKANVPQAQNSAALSEARATEMDEALGKVFRTARFLSSATAVGSLIGGAWALHSNTPPWVVGGFIAAAALSTAATIGACKLSDRLSDPELPPSSPGYRGDHLAKAMAG